MPRSLRLLGLELYAILAAIVAGSLIFERHRATYTPKSGDWGPWHSLALDGYLIPMALAATVVPVAWWARRRAPRGLLAAAAGIGAAIAIGLTHLLNHLFETTDSNPAGNIVGAGALALLGFGLVMLVSEPIAAYRARRGRGPALSEVDVSGRRRTLRDGFAVITGVVAVGLALLLVAERHVEVPVNPFAGTLRREWFIGDTYGAILLGPLAVLLAAFRARRGFPHGVICGLVTFAAAFAMLTTWFVMHTITHASSATNFMLLALAGLIVLGPAFAVADAVLHGRERRRTDTPGPSLPEARVVS